MTEATPKKRTAAPARLVLPKNMEISNLAAPLKKMRSLLNTKKKQLVLDGADVSVIDSAGVQLLVAFITTMTGKGYKLSWENYSVQVYQMASELGLAESLGD